MTEAAEVPSQDLLARYEFAIEAARQAGQLTLQYFQSGVGVDFKSDNTPVTVADREAELLVRKLVEQRFPNDTILGEEFPERKGDSAFRWIVDPIDGTKSFVCGVPLYTTLIGVECNGQAAVGVIEIPALEETVHAAKGHGAWLIRKGEKSAARVAKYDSMSDGLFTTSERATFDDRGAGDIYLQIESIARTARTWGDAYGYSLVATGRAAAMIDPIMSVWDAAAIQPILEEAGGVFTDWQGNPTIHGREGIGTTPELLTEILKITKTATPLPS
ncbi:MAG: inositol monophosphatase family protein [Planctomycetota bacterium]